MNTIIRFFIACFLLSGCAGPQVAVNPRADFSKIRRVAVASFDGPGGNTASDLFAQDLLKHGADVVERQRLEAILKEQQLSSSGILDPETTKKLGKILGVDAIIVGTVSNYTPGQSYIVQSSKEGQIVVGGTVTPVTGRNVYSAGSVLGLPDSHVVTSAAQAGIIARMVDVETGSLLWSGRMNYEGYDAETAMSFVTSSLVRSLVPLWPLLE